MASTLNKCPVCHSTEIAHVLMGIDRLHGIAGEWPLWKCQSCSVGFLNPLPSDDETNSFYPNNYYAYAPPTIASAPKSKFKRFLWNIKQARLDTHASLLGYPVQTNTLALASLKLLPVKTHIPSFVDGGAFLDIGCGAGQYLLQLKELGWETTGVEPSLDACQAAKQAGLNVLHGTISKVRFPDLSFDVVRMNDVLEHVCDPHATLEEICRILKPDGYIEITLPNFEAWTFSLFGEYWFPLEIPRHLYHHTMQSLRRLADQHGLRISDSRIWSHKEVDVLPSIVWLIRDKAPSVFKLIDYPFVWKSIRKAFALPKALATIAGRGSAITVQLKKRVPSSTD